MEWICTLIQSEEAGIESFVTLLESARYPCRCLHRSRGRCVRPASAGIRCAGLPDQALDGHLLAAPFCVMLAGTCQDGAVTWAERIREAIHRLEFPFVEQTRSVTASFGVAQRTEVTTDVIDRLSDELRRLRGAVCSSEGAAPLTLISASRMQDGSAAGSIATQQRCQHSCVSRNASMTGMRRCCVTVAGPGRSAPPSALGCRIRQEADPKEGF